MAKQTFYSRLTAKIIKSLTAIEENPDRNIGTPKEILVVRQHNQFGDLLASVPLFRALKETFPDSKVTLIVSPQNYYAVTQNEYIDKLFVFDKKKLLNPFYVFALIKLLRKKYDLAVVPVTVAISYTSSLLCRLANAKIRIGPASLNGAPNDFEYFFDRRVHLDWHKHPDAHVSDFGLEIVRPFGINTKDFTSEISFGESEIKEAEKFFEEKGIDRNKIIVGIHPGAGKPRNRWSLLKYIKVIEGLKERYDAEFVITGSKADIREINFLKENSPVELNYFLDRRIPVLAAMISLCDLFITNDTGVMHVAGATETPQISIFGPTNPFNWAPLGVNKYFIRKSDLIDDVTVEDVLGLAEMLLKPREEENGELKNVAVVDVGSNSFHLIIVRANKKGEFSLLDRKRKVLRLLEKNGEIGKKNFREGIETLKEFKNLAELFEADIIAFGTHDLREALNGKDFLETAKKETGIQIEIISGKREAELNFWGAAPQFIENDENVLCVDIGGGSVEFTLGNKNEILFAESLNIGAVKLTRMFCEDFTIDPVKLEKCRKFVEEKISPVASRIAELEFEKCVGTGGAIHSLAFLVAKSKDASFKSFEAVEGFELEPNDLDKIAGEIFTAETIEQRKQIDGMQEDRADVIPAGALILQLVFKLLKLKKVIVSTRGVREGALREFLLKNNFWE